MIESYDPTTGELLNRLDENGHEVPDDTPVAMPVGFSRPPTLIETIRAVIRTEVSQAAESQGMGSFDEEDDFDIDDEPADPTTPWEEVFEPDAPQPTVDDVKLAESLGKVPSDATQPQPQPAADEVEA
nr:MAG: hypothetical protein [Microvirus sp.]